MTLKSSDIKMSILTKDEEEDEEKNKEKVESLEPTDKYADIRRKKYNLNEKTKNKNYDDEETHRLNDNDVDSNVNDLNKDYNQSKESLKSNSMNKTNNNIEAATTTAATKTHKFSFLSKIDNLLNFNQKFSMEIFEKHYIKSYLSVTRRLFINHLFFLIIFCTCWIVYFSIENFRLDSKSIEPMVTIDQQYFTSAQNSDKSFINLDTLEDQALNLNVSYVLNKISLYKNETSKSLASNTLAIYYFVIMLLLFLVTFSFLLVAEIKEMRYRTLEKRIARQTTEGKFDTKTAERDLKAAMADVLNREKDMNLTKERLDKKYVSVDKLRDLYSKVAYTISLFVIFCMFLLCFILFVFPPASLRQLTHFIWFCESLLLLYLIYPFQIGVCVLVGAVLSMVFEIFSMKKQISVVGENTQSVILFSFVKILLHVSVHLIGAYLKLSFDGVKRGTFLKVAQMHKAHMNAQKNKDITERMIKSIMPPLFTHVFGKPEEFKKSVNTVHQMRPLFIYPVSELSILFADIVGFTKMSSTKTAEQLVFLLNDLYGRFDRLCEEAGCEKISTLGDCYYCVSGCLNERKDHASCCVKMGLLMVKEIETFNKAHDVDVNMRVGVHTGNALCGFIGGKRFRFDVWSGDVTLANKMESSGRAGWVHISEDTYNHLQNSYNTVPGEKYSSKNTYFVVRDNKRITVGQAISRRPPVNSNNSTVVSVQESNGTIDKSKVEDESSKQTEQNSSTIKQAPIMDQETQLLEAVKNAHFFQPDFNPITMRFGSSKEERNFKNFLMGTTNTKNSNFNDKSRKSDLTNDPSELVENTNIWMNQSKTFFLSILVSVITNICLLTAYFLAFLASSQSSNFNATPSYTSSLIMMICLFVGFLIVQVVFLTLSFVSKFNRIKSFSLVHVISAILLTIMPVFILATCLPITTTSFEYAWPSKIENSVFLSSHQNIFALYSFYCFAVAILHFCSFFQLGSLFKTLIALIFLVAFSLLGFIGLTSVFNKTESEKLDTYIETLNSNGYSASISSYTINFVTTLLVKGFLSENYVILVDFALLFILIWFINRQSELIQRLSFKCDQNAQNKVTYAREQKELANWLIEVVLPAHVVDHVQEKKQYSKNHECVGVLFVSLCNFWEFFEESYEGGRELLRVLNEITVDFDRLFDDPKYKNVEKIKSIGSTFMIASGLNPEASQDESDKTHLHDLIDFALELNEKLEAFNSEAMSVCHFKFQMRMGFNFGPVTSGVIGTERLLYDIWGDTVNVASRMDSTGQAGLMQCPQAVALMLKDDYNFFKRGPIQIKGKDEMITYFLNPKENKKLNLTT